MAEEQTPVDANELIRLRALVADYETKMTDAAALVARVRHEINNPLAGLLGQAQLLLREELAGKTREREARSRDDPRLPYPRWSRRFD